jgi:hypothetical protein
LKKGTSLPPPHQHALRGRQKVRETLKSATGEAAAVFPFHIEVADEKRAVKTAQHTGTVAAHHCFVSWGDFNNIYMALCYHKKINKKKEKEEK